MKCIIGGCVRNCEEYLYYVFQNIKKIQDLFDETQIIIAYDKSDDNSLSILAKLRLLFPNLTILLNDKPLTNIRTVNIANARNRILNEIRNKYSNYEFMIMIDCDNVNANGFNPNLFKSYLLRNDWDVLLFNKEIFYDIWALSIKPYVYSCWHWDNPMFAISEMRNYVNMKLSELSDNELLECVSAFNGFGIYRINKIDGCSYNGIFDINLFDKELLDLNTTILNNNLIDRIDDCEHRNFHVQMIKKNNARIRISPHILFK